MSDAITGRVRGVARPTYGEGIDSPANVTSGGELLVAQSLPAKTESIRLGNYWTVQIATASAFTNVAAMPTTRAELALYNGEPGNGKSYIIDQISFLSLTDVTAAVCATVIWQVASAAALTNDTAQLINSPLGMVYNGKALRALAVTTMTANKWTFAASGNTGAAKSIGLGIVAEINGGVIVRPGMTLGVNAVVGTATGTSLMGIAWREEYLPPL